MSFNVIKHWVFKSGWSAGTCTLTKWLESCVMNAPHRGMNTGVIYAKILNEWHNAIGRFSMSIFLCKWIDLIVISAYLFFLD